MHITTAKACQNHHHNGFAHPSCNSGLASAEHCVFGGEGKKKSSSWWYFTVYFYRDIFFPFAVTFSSRKSFPFTVTFSSRKSTGKSD
jgi:hypothetical protein